MGSNPFTRRFPRVDSVGDPLPNSQGAAELVIEKQRALTGVPSQLLQLDI